MTNKNLPNSAQLSADEKQAIVAAIIEAETITDGELYCVIARKSNDYYAAPIFLAAALSFLVPLGLYLAGIDFSKLPLGFGPQWSGWTVDNSLAAVVDTLLIQLFICWLIVLVLGRFSAFRLALTPKSTKRAAVHRHAVEQFAANGLSETSDQTGILIFVSLSERMAEVIADSRISAAVSDDEWADILSPLLTQAKDGKLGAGLVEALKASGALLAKHVPATGENPDQLPNRVVEI